MQKLYIHFISNFSLILIDTFSFQTLTYLVHIQFPPKSGELFVEVKKISTHICLKKEEWDLVLTFQEYLFSNFLKVVEFPMMFHPDSAEIPIIVVPVYKNKTTK